MTFDVWFLNFCQQQIDKQREYLAISVNDDEIAIRSRLSSYWSNKRDAEIARLYAAGATAPVPPGVSDMEPIE